MSHTHRRLQHATAPGILCVDVYRYDSVTGVHTLFDATADGGWNLFFRMWRAQDGRVLAKAAPASQPAVGQLLYAPIAAAVAVAGDFRGVFWARRGSDGKHDVWPVQTILIAAVDGGALVSP